jgi:hypothetical protein
VGGACNTDGKKQYANKLMVSKPEGRRPLGRRTRRWVDNIKTDLGKIEWGDVDWICLTRDRKMWRALVKAVVDLRVP